MLRWMLLLLVLANALVWLYFQSWLAPLGLTPPPPIATATAEAPVTELAPEALRLLPAQPASEADASAGAQSSPDNRMAEAPAPSQDSSGSDTDAATPAAASGAAETPGAAEPANTAASPAPPTQVQAAPANAPADTPIAQTKPANAGVCWEARGLSPEQARALGPAGKGWELEPVALAERWIVYIGPLPGEAMNRRRGELRQANIDFRRVDKPGLAPGLALATVASEAEGQGELRRFKSRGVRDVQLKKERDAASAFTLRLPQGSNAERDALATKLGQPLVRCK